MAKNNSHAKSENAALESIAASFASIAESLRELVAIEKETRDKNKNRKGTQPVIVKVGQAGYSSGNQFPNPAQEEGSEVPGFRRR